MVGRVRFPAQAIAEKSAWRFYMKVIGTIPTMAQVKMDEVIVDEDDIQLVWANPNEVHVVGVRFLFYKRRHEVFGYRFYTLGERWLWAEDYSDDFGTE